MIPRTSVNNAASNATRYLRACGKENSHCRTGTFGITRSTRCAAVSDILRPQHDGQNPRFLQEYGKSRFLPQDSHRRRRKPRSKIPQSRNDRSSFSTKPGTGRSRACCISGNVSSCSATTRYRRLLSGCRGVYSEVTGTPAGQQTRGQRKRGALTIRNPIADPPKTRGVRGSYPKMSRKSGHFSPVFHGESARLTIEPQLCMQWDSGAIRRSSGQGSLAHRSR